MESRFSSENVARVTLLLVMPSLGTEITNLSRTWENLPKSEILTQHWLAVVVGTNSTHTHIYIYICMYTYEIYTWYTPQNQSPKGVIDD